MLHRHDLVLCDSYNIPHLDILNLVTDKVLASYLGVIPSHLSNIKKEIIEEELRLNKKSQSRPRFLLKIL